MSAPDQILEFHKANELLLNSVYETWQGMFAERSQYFWQVAKDVYDNMGRCYFLVAHTSLSSAIDWVANPTDTCIMCLPLCGTRPDYVNGVKMIQEYNPENWFVVLVLISVTETDGLFYGFGIDKEIQEHILDKRGGITIDEIHDSSTLPSISKLLLKETFKVNGCQVCGKNTNTRACGKCQAARYCGKDCQSQDWLAHKSSCQIIVKNRKQGPEFNVKQESRFFCIKRQ